MPTNASANRSKAVRIAAHAVDENGAKPLTEITLKNGIILGIKPVPPFLIRRAQQAVPKPKVPTFHNDATGRDEENLLSAEWEDAKAEWEIEKGEVAANAMLIAGTWVKTVPDDMAGFESDDWLEVVEFLRIPVELHCWKCVEGNDPVKDCGGCNKARYLSWLNLYALDSEAEWYRVLVVVGRQVGINEEEITEALSSFRRGAQRGANNAASAQDARNGNYVPEEPTESST